MKCSKCSCKISSSRTEEGICLTCYAHREVRFVGKLLMSFVILCGLLIIAGAGMIVA